MGASPYLPHAILHCLGCSLTGCIPSCVRGGLDILKCCQDVPARTGLHAQNTAVMLVREHSAVKETNP